MNTIERSDKSSAQPIPRLEWLIAAVGIVLVVGNFGYLGWRAAQEKTPPSFVAEIASVEPSNQGFLVRINVKNNGGTPVADLRLIATFSGTEKSSEVMIDYLPSRSNRTAGFLTNDPVKPDEVTFHFESFTEP